MGYPKNAQRRQKLRCQGETADGVSSKFPMKAVVFARGNPRGSIAVLYRPGSGSVIGAFSHDALVALEVTARQARLALAQLLKSSPKMQKGAEHV